MTPFLWGVVTAFTSVGCAFGVLGALIDQEGPLRSARYAVAGLVIGAVTGFAVCVVVLGIQAVFS